jgi:hypothetical protein
VAEAIEAANKEALATGDFDTSALPKPAKT